MRLWVDIENPPQVQYLLPVAHAVASLDADVMVTARDYGETFALLDDRGEPHRRVGGAYGASKGAKVSGLARRVIELVRAVRAERPDVLVCASRAAVIAARMLRVPSYVILDYEFVDARVFRFAGSTILHPDVIPPDAFRRQRIPTERLVAFRGVKEDLTFAEMDVSEIPPANLGSGLADIPRVLVRPAAEESHYFRPESKTLMLRTLAHLGQQNVQVVFSPRYERQAADLERHDWRIAPVVLRRPVPFVPLLKSVDAVVCSGGTMFREAAYVGIDAYSIFQGELGAVDLYLEQIGRATIIRSASELEHIRVERRPGPLDPLRSNNALAHEIARLTMQR